jgi:orotate phosphoribosyltransferase
VSESHARLLDALRRDAWRRGRFRLASGRESDFFIDCKQVILTAEGHRLVGEALYDAIRGAGVLQAVAGVAGVALGGCSLASAVSLTSALRDGDAGLDALYVRKEPKDHGTARRVERPTL